MNHKVTITAALVLVGFCALNISCSQPKAHPAVSAESLEAQDFLDPKSANYDLDRAISVIDSLVAEGKTQKLELQPNILITLLKQQKTLQERNRNLEQKLQSIKKIDLGNDKKILEKAKEGGMQ